MTGYKAILDVGYRSQEARGICNLIRDWQDETPVASYEIQTVVKNDYVPGALYKRELPVLLELLEQVIEPIGFLVIDGYVWLDAVGEAAGLGAKLYEAMVERIPVIGVAKNPYREALLAKELYRGKSKNPLYISSVGIDLHDAFISIASMHGKNRIPTVIKLTDQHSKLK